MGRVESIQTPIRNVCSGKDVDGHLSGPDIETTIKHSTHVFEDASFCTGLDLDRWLWRFDIIWAL